MDLLQLLAGAMFGGGQPQRRAPSAAERDFPGRTNYGVPEDDMIDSPMGYMTPHQYNGLAPVMQGTMQRTQNPQFQHTPFSEGTNIQGNQFDARMNPQLAFGRLQQGINPQRKRNR